MDPGNSRNGTQTEKRYCPQFLFFEPAVVLILAFTLLGVGDYLAFPIKSRMTTLATAHPKTAGI